MSDTSALEGVKRLLVELGAGWVLWLLFALSLWSAARAAERWVALGRAGADLRALSERLHELLSAGRAREAAEELGASPSVAARVAAAGLRLALSEGELSERAVERAMESRVALERERLEAPLAALGTLGNNAPFIGLFGTVIGIIQAFEELGHGAAGHAPGGAAAVEQVASSGVMYALSEALVATAVGIAVALPAVALFNALQRRLDGVLAGAEVTSKLTLAYLATRACREALARESGAAGEGAGDAPGGGV